jgi:hypothetical protein
MNFLKTKKYWILAFLIMMASLIYPSTYEPQGSSSPESGSPFNEYSYGLLFPFLTLRTAQVVTGSQNVFRMGIEAENYFFGMGDFLGSFVFCFVLSYLIIKLYNKIFK